MPWKRVEPVEYDEEGNLVYNLNSDLANDDWIRAARLKRKAEQGNEEAAKELERMENTRMYKEGQGPPRGKPSQEP